MLHMIKEQDYVTLKEYAKYSELEKPIFSIGADFKDGIYYYALMIKHSKLNMVIKENQTDNKEDFFEEINNLQKYLNANILFSKNIKIITTQPKMSF